jgi:hypothetical protein
MISLIPPKEASLDHPVATLGSAPSATPMAPPLTRRELGLLMAGLLALVAGQLAATGAHSLFGRNFWLDELFTYTLVFDPDLGHSFHALASGVDVHPPALYSTLRVLTLGGVLANEITLRVAAFGFMLAAVIGLYVSLRDSFKPLVCIAACLAVWSHPAVISQALEARSYGAWLAGAIWYAYVLRRVRLRPGPGLKLLLAGLALFVCTIHYFGIISLTLITAGELVPRAGASGRTRVIWPAALGPVGLAACLPMLMQQRAAYTVATWVPPATLGSAVDFIVTLLMPPYVLVALVAAMFWVGVAGAGGQKPLSGLRLQAGLLGLALIPVVLIVFSFTVQPVLIYRYGLLALAALAPVVAWALSDAPRGAVLACCGLFLFLGSWELHNRAAHRRLNDAAYARLGAVLDCQLDDRSIIFEDAHHAFVLNRYRPDLAGRCRFLDFDENDPPASELDVIARDLMRQYVHFYSAPATMPWANLRTLPRFYLVIRTERNAEVPLEHSYPGFTPRHVYGQLYEMIANE